MEEKEIIKTYFETLEQGDYEKLMELFDDKAIAKSPLYGKLSVKKFYKKLLEDTGNSKIDLLHIFVNKEKNNGAGHFRYNWILKDNSNSSFEGVDVFNFNNKGKIQQITIIYDTYGTRESFNKMKEEMS